MNIFHVTRGYGKLMPSENPGALESVIFNLSKNLSSIGHNVTIIDGGIDAGEYEKRKILENVSISVVKTNKLFLIRPEKIKITRLVFEELHFIYFGYKASKCLKKLDANDIDIVHVHSTMVGIAMSIFSPKLISKMVYTSHVNIWSLDQRSFLENIIIFLDIILMKRVKTVIALNSFLKDRYLPASKISPDKINVVNNGVDIESFNITDTSRLNGKYKLRDLNVLFVGRFDEIKGIKYLISAANILINDWKYKDILFILVGSHVTTNVNKSENLSDIDLYINNHKLDNNIIMTGHIPDDDLKMLYNICDIVVVPSLAEADPLVTLEAMAAGKPIIGTRVGGIPNQVIDSYNGFIIEPANEFHIADKILYLLKNRDQLKIFGENSKKRVEECFSWRKVSNDLSVVYSKLYSKY